MGLGFVLYGGTAIALQLAHRISTDFDFFSHQQLDSHKEAALMAALPFLAKAAILQKETNTRTYLTEEGVKLSFFGGINFGRIGRPLVSNDAVLQVASLDDLLAIKLAVLLKRVEAKDYQDIAAMLRASMRLEQGLGGAQTLYGENFSPLECVKALVFFQGGDLETLPGTDREILVDTVKNLRIDTLPRIRLCATTLTG